MIANTTLPRVSQRDEVLDLASLTEVSAFMSRVFTPADDTTPPVGQRKDEHPRDDQPSATEADRVDLLLGKASKAIEVLAARCEIMEQEMANKDDLLAEREQAAKQWRQFAAKLQAQTTNDQNTIAHLVARSDAAEARIASLEAAASEAQERSAAAHSTSTRLQSQVIAAFGSRSPVHSVLEAITLQEAAE